MAERERIARLLYEAWPERGPLMARPWPEMMERKQEPWLALADALLGAREETCTNAGCVLPDRAGKSYQCTGDAQWCTACLRWHYEPLEIQLTTARERVAVLEAEDAEAITEVERLIDRAEQAEARERALRALTQEMCDMLDGYSQLFERPREWREKARSLLATTADRSGS